MPAGCAHGPRRSLVARRGSSTRTPRTAPTRYSDPATTTAPSAARREPAGSASPSTWRAGDPTPRAPVRQRAASSPRASPGRLRPRRHDGRAGQRLDRAERGDDAVDILVGHHRHHQRDRAGRRNGRRSSSACASAAAPAGLCAPSSSTSRAIAAQELEPARPVAARVAAPAGLVRHGRDPGLGERIERRVRNRRVRRLMASAQPDRGRPQPRQVDVSVSRSQPSTGAGATSVSGAPTRRARRRMTASASPSRRSRPGRRAR